MEASLLINESAIPSWQLLKESLLNPPTPLYEGTAKLATVHSKGVFKSPFTQELVRIFEDNPTLRKATAQQIQALAEEPVKSALPSVVQRRLDDLARYECGYLIRVPNPMYKRGVYSKHLYTRNWGYTSDWLDDKKRTDLLLAGAKERSKYHG